MNSAKNGSPKSFVAIVIVVSLAFSLYMIPLLLRQASAQTTHEVKISSFAFIPQNLTISPGDTIVWNNTDAVIHILWFTYVANASTYLLSDLIVPGATWNHTFNDIAELKYYSFDKLWITGFINVATDLHDVAVTNFNTTKTGCLPKPTVGEGYTANVTVVVENQGGFIETFNVTAKADSNIIGTLQVNSLNPGENRTLLFVWNTNGYPYGNYTISTEAILPSDEDPDDNTFVDGNLKVVVPGDINGDAWVELGDFYLASTSVGYRPWDPEWNPNADLNDDTYVELGDFYIISYHVGGPYGYPP